MTGALDVDPRHQRDVGHGVDDTREVHDDVDALEQRFQLGAGDVDPGEFDRARAPFGLAHVETEDAIDVGMGGEDGEEMTAHESGGAGDRNGMHPHTLTAWPTRLNLETPKSPTNSPNQAKFRAFRPTCSADSADRAATSTPPPSISRRSTCPR